MIFAGEPDLTLPSSSGPPGELTQDTALTPRVPLAAGREPQNVLDTPPSPVPRGPHLLPCILERQWGTKPPGDLSSLELVF